MKFFSLRIFPVLTLGVVAINVIVFVYTAGLWPMKTAFTAFTAYSIFGKEFSVTAAVTSMFMHYNFGHIFGNMLILVICGWAVEDDLGPFTFLGFYLFTGFMAAVAHAAFGVGEEAVPMAGASGAVAGVMGGYYVLIPQARMQSFRKHGCASIGLSLFVGFLVLLLLARDIKAVLNPTAGGGVAHWAHVGGASSGALLGLLLRPRLRTHKEMGTIVAVRKRRTTAEEEEARDPSVDDEQGVWVNWVAVNGALAQGQWPPRVQELAHAEDRDHLVPLLQRMLGHMLRQDNQDKVKEIQGVLKLLGVRLRG